MAMNDYLTWSLSTLWGEWHTFQTPSLSICDVTLAWHAVWATTHHHQGYDAILATTSRAITQAVLYIYVLLCFRTSPFSLAHSILKPHFSFLGADITRLHNVTQNTFSIHLVWGIHTRSRAA